MAAPLADTNIFPPLALSMIKVGEETGQLDTMLLKVASTYEKSLSVAIKRFVNLLEPAMILIVGGIVVHVNRAQSAEEIGSEGAASSIHGHTRSRRIGVRHRLADQRS